MQDKKLPFCGKLVAFLTPFCSEIKRGSTEYSSHQVLLHSTSPRSRAPAHKLPVNNLHFAVLLEHLCARHTVTVSKSAGNTAERSRNNELGRLYDMLHCSNDVNLSQV
jgi:hypothetical protein